MNRGAPILVASCLALAAADLVPARAPAQVTLTPRVIQIDQVKCSDLQSAPDESRILLYFNGYVDGMRGLKVWDERKVAELVDRALGYCKADPNTALLSAFTRASR